MAITLTDRAAHQVANSLGKRGRGLGIRLGVKTTGCSGLAYKIEYADVIHEKDVVFQVNDNVQLVVDKESYLYLDGTEVDFVREGLSEGFKFSNPNVKAMCGCGESFTV